MKLFSTERLRSQSWPCALALTVDNVILFIDAVWQQCSGESRDYLETLCTQLPDENCFDGREPRKPGNCGEYEFDCGNDQCVSGLGVCDRERDCATSADEIGW